MKLTSKQLRDIIKEEIQNKMMDEGEYDITSDDIKDEYITSDDIKDESTTWQKVVVYNVRGKKVKEYSNKIVNDVVNKLTLDGDKLSAGDVTLGYGFEATTAEGSLKEIVLIVVGAKDSAAADRGFDAAIEDLT